MSVPKSRTGWAKSVAAAMETTTGSGVFEVDDRLAVEEAEQLSDGRIAEAHLTVRTDATFPPAEAQARYHPDRRIIVICRDAVLFDGFPLENRLSLGSPTARSRQSHGSGVQLVLEHVCGRLGRDASAQIIGRHARDAEIEAGMAADPAAWAGSSRLMTALPCIFNANGKANCDPTPIIVSDDCGGSRNIHIFTDDDRAEAVPWTYSRVLRYLLHFYNGRNRPVCGREVLRQTDAIAEQPPEGREAYLSEDDLSYRLLGRPDTLVAEATNLLEALMLVARSGGVHFSTESERAGRGARTSWRIWTTASGGIRDLRLASAARDANGQPIFDPASVSTEELFEANNVSAARLSWDVRRTAMTAMVIGGVKRYEILAELLPGWLPRSGLDNVDPSQRSSAKSVALSDTQILSLGPTVANDPWYRQYHREGAEFSTNWQVGRLWVLNEAGSYPSATYARNAPFDQYGQFDFSQVAAGPWMSRRRRLLPVALLPADQPRVIVEVSFDNGGSWMTIEAGYAVLPDECGIWLDVPNLLSIASDVEDTNLWDALVDQTFRLRVRAFVEADARLIVRRTNDAGPTLFNNASVLYAPDRYQFARRLNDVIAMPQTSGGGVPGARDDSVMMQRVADAMVADSGREVAGRVVIPWLDRQYEIGDRIIGIRGRGIDTATRQAPNRRHACVVGKRYLLGSSRRRTELLLSSADQPALHRVMEG